MKSLRHSVLLILSPIFLASCSFQKNPKSDNFHPADYGLQQQAIKPTYFCGDEDSRNDLPSATLLALSTSDQAKDLCIVWKQVKKFQENDIEEDNLEVVDNFTESALNYILKSGKPLSHFSIFAKELTNLSIALNGSSLKNTIVINNMTKNSVNNLSLIPYLKDRIDLLFLSTNDLSSNEFTDYWKSIEEIHSKDNLCTELTLSKVILHKTVSAHLLSISNSCKFRFAASQIIEARTRLNVPVSDNELRYFRNSIKSKTISVDGDNILKMRKVVFTAIAREDANLLRLTKSIPRNENLLFLFTLAYSTQSKIEPFIEKLNQSDLTDDFEWSKLESALNSKGLKQVLNLLYKQNIFPTHDSTLSIVGGLKEARMNHPRFYSDSSIIDLFEYLRSSTGTRLPEALQKTKYIEQELGLIFNGTAEPTLIESLTGQSINDVRITFVNSLLSFSKFLFSLESTPGTYRINGPIFVALGKHSDLKNVGSEKFIYFVKDDGNMGFSISMDSFLTAMSTGRYDDINLDCSGPDCNTIVPIYQAGTRSLLKRIAEKYKSPAPQ
ncbi:hypothetical protein [Bdellovibrio sp. HCB209]|uniref:hypothetical protein n=1 Tax=Bdellovibrio sp. HCB209 TaxID=3394354 RepID=UPI0039B5AB9F